MNDSDLDFDQLGFTREELRAAMRSNYDDLLEFFYSDAFQEVYASMKAMSAEDRNRFVKEVLIDPDRLREETGIEIPEGVLIQRSAFGDRRPTVFCLKKFLPERFHRVWENTNLTFDETYEDESVSRVPQVAWRAPIRPDVQAIFMSIGYPLDEVPDSFRLPLDSPDPVVPIAA